MRAGFPHSEIFGSKLACQLPEAYRRLQRPSSPVVAKASTTCTCSLDPITVRTVKWMEENQSIDPRARRHRFLIALGGIDADKAAIPIISNAISYPDESDRLRQSDSPCFFRIFKEQPNKTKCTAKRIFEMPLRAALRVLLTDPGGANRDRTGDLLLAKQALSQLSYGPRGREHCDRENHFDPGAGVGWWVWMDSNHRPPPYQDDALTN